MYQSRLLQEQGIVAKDAEYVKKNMLKNQTYSC